MPHAIGDDGRLQHLGEYRDLGAGIERTAADDDHRTLGRAQHLGGSLDLRIAWHGLRERRRHGRQRQARLLAPYVERTLQPDGPRSPRHHLPEGFVGQMQRLVRSADAGGPFRQPLHDAELIGNVMQEARIAVDIGQRHLPAQRQHHGVVAVGIRQRGGRVEKARPRYDAIGGRLAGDRCRAERHVGRPLFMSRVDRFDAVRLVEQRIEERIVLHAGQTIQCVDAVRDQAFDDDVSRCAGGGGGTHGALLRWVVLVREKF